MSWPLRLCLGLFSLLIIVPMPAPTLAQQASPAALPQQQEQTKRAPPVIGQDKEHEQQQLQPAGGDTKAQNIFPLGQLPVALVEPKQRFSYQSQSTKRVAELAQPAVGGGKKRPELFSVPKERVPTARAQLTVRLKRHSNPSRRMQNATTCACPQSQQDEGNCGKEGGNRSPCYMAFTAVASAADQTVDFRSTPFVVVDSSGIIDALREPEWGAKMEWALPAKPRFVDIYAYNLGPVFSLYDGRILSWSETVWPVDAWTVDLEELVPYSWAEPMAMATHRELSGRYDTESILNLDFSVQCLYDFMGPECDLRCQRENVNAQPEMVRLYGGANRLTNEVVRSPQLPAQLPAAQMPTGGLGGEVSSGGGGGPLGWTICESALEQRRFFECHYRDGRRIQVDSCKFCEFGILNDSVCVHDPAKLRMEPDDFLFYKTGFIVLAVALAICLLILVLGCCIACWIFCCRQSAKDRRHSSAMGGGTYRRGAGAPYNISENGFGSNRLGDPLTHPLLTNSGQKAANGQIAVDWTKPAQPPAAVQRGILLQHPHHPHPPSSMSPQQQPAVGGGGGEFGPMAASSPNTSESDYRPSPFTPRREAQV